MPQFISAYVGIYALQLLLLVIYLLREDKPSLKVDWQYFQEKYKGVPADSIVDQRIKMAARYASKAWS